MNTLFGWKKSLPIGIGKSHANPLLSLQEEFNKVLGDFYSDFESPSTGLNIFEGLTINPSIDIVEDDKSFKVEAEMPGMGENDVKVEIRDGKLFIKGEKEVSKKDKSKNYVMREIGYGSYERSILLPESADIEKATASFKKGMLWIDIPKKSGALTQSRELKVQKVQE